MRRPRQYGAALVSYVSNAHWPQARLCGAGERSHARCCACGEERGTLWHRLFACPVLAGVRRDSVSQRLMSCAVKARALGEGAGEDFARCWLLAPFASTGWRTSDMGSGG